MIIRIHGLVEKKHFYFDIQELILSKLKTIIPISKVLNNLEEKYLISL